MSGLLSLSSTSPTLPSGYTKKRLVGWARNNSGGDLYNFIQYNDNVYLQREILMLSSGAATSPTAVDLSGILPVIASVVNINILATVGFNAPEAASLEIMTDPTGLRIMSARWQAVLNDLYLDTSSGEIPFFTPQTIWYKQTAGTAGRGAIWVTGYKLDL